MKWKSTRLGYELKRILTSYSSYPIRERKLRLSRDEGVCCTRKGINDARLPRRGQLFPQLIKLLTLSRGPKLIRIGTRLHRANIIQVVVLSGRTSTGERELWAFRSGKGVWPYGRVAFLPMPDPHTNVSADIVRPTRQAIPGTPVLRF